MTIPKGWQRDRHTGELLLRTPLKLIGGKTHWRDKLYRLFPPHDVYAEPFLGSAAVLIGKKPLKEEYASDTNKYTINFLINVRDNPELLYSTIRAMHSIWDEPYFQHAKKIVTQTPNLLLQSAMFYLVTKHSMNGIWRLNKSGQCNSSWCGTTSGRGILTEEWMQAVSERLQKTTLETQDFSQTLTRIAMNPKAFVFLDPPYLDCRTTYNGQAFARQDFQHLADWLERVDFKWLMTVNDHPVLLDMFAKYHIQKHEVYYSCSQTAAGRGKKGELIITNYETSQRQRLRKLTQMSQAAGFYD
jgi:DNA adenine methylase